jgi:hypothetical protein
VISPSFIDIRYGELVTDYQFEEKAGPIMQKSILPGLTMILGLALTCGVTAQSAEDGNRNVDQRAFVGLWQGIDSFDGSTQLLSITCDRSRACDVRVNDTAFTFSCPNQIGFARGIGSVERGVLTVELTLHCSNLYGASTLVGSQFNEFVFDRKNGTLMNVNDDPVPVSNVFHKISQ